MKRYNVILIIFLWHLSIGYASKTFTISTLTKKNILSRDSIRALGLKHIKMDYSRAYPGINMDYYGVRLCDLLSKYSINPRHTLEFIAQDDFSVLIPAKYVLNCNDSDSIAYLVVEPNQQWPILFNHTNTTAGPYAIIWTNPERSYISDEYWAWSVIKMVEHSAINDNIVIGPPENLPRTGKKHILNGYQVYVSHCSSCHTINHIGQAKIGPDLLSPKSIFDYYPDINQLKKFIRDPQSMRKLPKGRMSGSSYIGLKNDDLDDLVTYFKFKYLGKSYIVFRSYICQYVV